VIPFLQNKKKCRNGSMRRAMALRTASPRAVMVLAPSHPSWSSCHHGPIVTVPRLLVPPSRLPPWLRVPRPRAASTVAAPHATAAARRPLQPLMPSWSSWFCGKGAAVAAPSS
jgi:hypothetical protein